MSITEDYVKNAEECERLARTCIAESNRNVLLYTAAHWRLQAEEAAADPAPRNDSGGKGDERPVSGE